MNNMFHSELSVDDSISISSNQMETRNDAEIEDCASTNGKDVNSSTDSGVQFSSQTLLNLPERSKLSGYNFSAVRTQALVKTDEIEIFEPGLISSSSRTTINQLQNYLSGLGLPVKRGRGRPRRCDMAPLGGKPTLPATFTVPISGDVGLQDIGTLSNAENTTSEQTEMDGTNQVSIIIQLEDGTEKHIIISSMSSLPADSVSEQGHNTTVITTEENDTATASDDVFTLAEGGEEEEEQESDPGLYDYDVVALEPPLSSNTSSLTSMSSSTPLDGSYIQIPEDSLLEKTTFYDKKSHPMKIGIKSNDTDLTSLRCGKCEFQSYYLQQHQQHIIDNHSGAENTDDVHRCKCCSFLSLDLQIMHEHYLVNHPHNVCSVCPFTAEHVYQVRRHIERHALNGFECQLCGKRYKDQYILKMHCKMVHLPASATFRCPVCLKEFTRKAHLKRHARTHDLDKAYQCNLCSYRGCERSDVAKHMLIHDDPRHACEVCGKTFRHVKNRDLHVKRHLGQRDFKCGLCNFFGYTFTDIRKHIERKHIEQTKSFACQHCKCLFRSASRLSDHLKKSECGTILICQQMFCEDDEENSSPLHDDNESDDLCSIDHAMMTSAATVIITDSEVIGTGHSVIMERDEMSSVGGIEFDSQSLVPSSWSVGDGGHALTMDDGIIDARGRLLVSDVDGQHCLVGCHSLVTDAGGHLLVSEDGHSLVISGEDSPGGVDGVNDDDDDRHR